MQKKYGYIQPILVSLVSITALLSIFIFVAVTNRITKTSAENTKTQLSTSQFNCKDYGNAFTCMIHGKNQCTWIDCPEKTCGPRCIDKPDDLDTYINEACPVTSKTDEFCLKQNSVESCDQNGCKWYYCSNRCRAADYSRWYQECVPPLKNESGCVNYQDQQSCDNSDLGFCKWINCSNGISICGYGVWNSSSQCDFNPSYTPCTYNCNFTAKTIIRECVNFDNAGNCLQYQKPQLPSYKLDQWGTSNDAQMTNPSTTNPVSKLTSWSSGTDNLFTAYNFKKTISSDQYELIDLITDRSVNNIGTYANTDKASVKLFYDKNNYQILDKYISKCDNEIEPLLTTPLTSAEKSNITCHDTSIQPDIISGFPMTCGQNIEYGWDIRKCQPLDILLLVDTSTSMGVFEGKTGDPRIKDVTERLKLFQKSVENYLKDTESINTRIGMIQFNKKENTRVIIPFETIKLTSSGKLDPSSKLAKVINNNTIYIKQEKTNPKLCLCDKAGNPPSDRNCIKDRCIKQTSGINYIINSAPADYLGFELSEGTCIECILDQAKQLFASLPVNDYETRQKIAVLITDAQSNSLDDPSSGYQAGIDSANALKADNIILSVIGIGQDEAELGDVSSGIAFSYMQKLASSKLAFLDYNIPASSYWQYIYDFNPCLKTIKSKISLTPTMAPNPTISLDACDLEVGLVIDNSGSIGSSVSTIKNAFTQFVDSLTGTPTKISLTVFSDDAQVVQPMTSDFQLVKDQINSYSGQQGNTNMTDAVTASRNTFSNTGYNKIMIIATDGVPDDIASTIKQVNMTRSSPYNIRIIAIAIGIRFSYMYDNLFGIFGSNINNPYIINSDVVTTDFSQLASSLNDFAANVCKSKIMVNKYINEINNKSHGGSNWIFSIGGKRITTNPDGKTVPVIVTPGVDYSVSEIGGKPGYKLNQAYCLNQNNQQLGNSVPTALQIEDVNLKDKEAAICTFINNGPTLTPVLTPGVFSEQKTDAKINVKKNKTNIIEKFFQGVFNLLTK